MNSDLIARLEAAENTLCWLGVHIPRKGLPRWLWEYLIPSACRENLERHIAALLTMEGEG